MNIRFLCFLLLFVTCAYAVFEDSFSITDIVHHLDPTISAERTLIVLDLDNMVILSNVEPEDQLGSPQWLGAMIRKKMQRSGVTKLQALEYTLPIHFRLVDHVTLTPVEGEKTVRLIRLLQDAGYRVIALTARSPEYCKKATIEQLNGLGIDFNRSKLGDHNYIFDDRFQYIDGIVFVAGGNKGDRLWTLLQTVGYVPELVIAADDKDYYLHEIEGVLQQYGIHHICLWYRYCDRLADAYDLAMSQGTVDILCKSDPELQALYDIWSQKETHHAPSYRQTYSVT